RRRGPFFRKQHENLDFAARRFEDLLQDQRDRPNRRTARADEDRDAVERRGLPGDSRQGGLVSTGIVDSERKDRFRKSPTEPLAQSRLHLAFGKIEFLGNQGETGAASRVVVRHGRCGGNFQPGCLRMRSDNRSGKPPEKRVGTRLVKRKAAECAAQTYTAPDKQDNPNQETVTERRIKQKRPPGRRPRGGKSGHALAIGESTVQNLLAGRVGVRQERPRRRYPGDQL